MLPSFSNHFLVPDDVSVPCRVQRYGENTPSVDENSCSEDQSTTIRQQPSEQSEEMTCTMRKWHRTSNSSSEYVSPQLRKSTSDSKTKEDDAELILTRTHCVRNRHTHADGNTPIPLSRRFASFGGPEILHNEEEQPLEEIPTVPIALSHHPSDVQGSVSQHTASSEEWTIPVEDIKVVRTFDGDEQKSSTKKRKDKSESSSRAEHRRRRTIGIETSSFGSYELLMESTNELLVLTTFLKVNSTKGKVAFVTSTGACGCDVIQETATNSSGRTSNNDATRSKPPTVHNTTEGDQDYQRIDPNPSNVTHDTAHTDGDKSIDVEAFTAKRMSERLNRETLTEKVERRMHRLVSSLEELSTSFTNCACGCFGDSTVTMDQSLIVEKERLTSSRPRQNTASTVSLSDTIENNDDDPLPQPDLRRQRKLLMKQAQFPSGLSVESEDFVEDLMLYHSPSSPGGGSLLPKASI